MGILNGLSPLSPQEGAADGSQPQPRLVRAAHEFEAQMMKELTAPLTSSQSIFGEEEEEGSNSALGSFAGEALAQAISERGGLGIAKSIIHQLSAKGNHSQGYDAPQNPGSYPTNSPHK